MSIVTDIRNAYEMRDREQLERALAKLVGLPGEKPSPVPCHCCASNTGCHCFGAAPPVKGTQ